MSKLSLIKPKCKIKSILTQLCKNKYF